MGITSAVIVSYRDRPIDGKFVNDSRRSCLRSAAKRKGTASGDSSSSPLRSSPWWDRRFALTRWWSGGDSNRRSSLAFSLLGKGTEARPFSAAGFNGRPPSFPFRRAAACFRFERLLPPSRPSIAAGFSFSTIMISSENPHPPNLASRKFQMDARSPVTGPIQGRQGGTPPSGNQGLRRRG